MSLCVGEGPAGSIEPSFKSEFASVSKSNQGEESEWDKISIIPPHYHISHHEVTHYKFQRLQSTCGPGGSERRQSK